MTRGDWSSQDTYNRDTDKKQWWSTSNNRAWKEPSWSSAEWSHTYNGGPDNNDRRNNGQEWSKTYSEHQDKGSDRNSRYNGSQDDSKHSEVEGKANQWNNSYNEGQDKEKGWNNSYNTGPEDAKQWKNSSSYNEGEWKANYKEGDDKQWGRDDGHEWKGNYKYGDERGDKWEEKKEEPIDWEKVLPSLPPFEKDFYVAHPDVEARTPEEVAAILTMDKIQVVPSSQVAWQYSDGESSRCLEARPIPKPVTNMMEASFPEYITAKLCQQLGGPFVEPTSVQKLLWPVALSGRDCMAIAPTGTGKTLGYLLPAIVHISAQEPVKVSDQSPIVLIVAPTRELAQQIMEQATLYGSAITDLGAQALTPVCVFGGVRKIEQKQQLETTPPDMVVATPGRLMDFLREGTINLRRVTYFVIDEVDRLISTDGKIGLCVNEFVDSMKYISSLIRPDRQCIMCSATGTSDVMSLSRDLCANEPVFFQVADADSMSHLVVSSNVDQQFAEAGDSEYDRIHYLSKTVLPGTFTQSLSRSEQKVMIFANSKAKVDLVTEQLRIAGWPAIGVHGGKTQEEREWIFSSFKSGVCNILVATDVMGRGMDFEDVRCVVNFDLPESIEAYIHRVGRTGRIGKKLRKGYALSLLTSRDWDILKGLEKMLHDSGIEISPVLAHRIEKYRNYQK